VIAPTTRRTRGTIPLAALLVVIQGLAGGLVPLVHASERLSAPAHVEARHDAGCLALHDELRCALCHYASSRVQPQQARTFTPTAAQADRRVPPPAVAPLPRFAPLTSPPRAPPSSRL
jgi:hypothetical protein